MSRFTLHITTRQTKGEALSCPAWKRAAKGVIGITHRALQTHFRVSALPQANNAQVANGANIDGAGRLRALQEGIPDRGWCARGKEKAALSSQDFVMGSHHFLLY